MYENTQMGSRVEIDLAKQLGLEWTNKNLEKDLAEHSKAIAEAEKRQYDLTHPDLSQFPNHHFDLLRTRAFNLDLTVEEMLSYRSQDSDRFERVYAIAIELIISGARPEEGAWVKAEIIYQSKVNSQEILLDNISKYHHSRSPFKKEPKPGKMYTKFHKPRSQKGWRERAAKKLHEYIEWEKSIPQIAEIMNTEQETEADRFPEFGQDHD